MSVTALRKAHLFIAAKLCVLVVGMLSLIHISEPTRPY